MDRWHWEVGTYEAAPANGDVGALELKITAMLTPTQQASQTVTLQVTNTNDAPRISYAVGDLSVKAGEALEWALSPHHVQDDDPQDRYSYTVQRADAPDLPAWLSFDPVTGRLKGQPASGYVGPVQLRLTVQDTSGASSERLFTLQVDPAATQAVGDTGGHDAPAAFATAAAAAASYATTATAYNDVPLGRGQENLMAERMFQNLLARGGEIGGIFGTRAVSVPAEPYRMGPIPPQTEGQRINAMVDSLVHAMAAFAPTPPAHTTFTPMRERASWTEIAASLN